MPGKKGSKKGKKKKVPAFFTEEEDTLPFGFRVNDLVRTPFGTIATVLGVKYSDPETKEVGKLWVTYASGQQSPLEPTNTAGPNGFSLAGYRRCSEAEHTERDVKLVQMELQKRQEERKQLIEEMKLRAMGIEPPTKGKGDKGGKKKGGKKGKKKK
eukprot:TRINITY_DN15153_c0_g1_i1.p2 TRINITY_DN15153_c0_g1~~TRINITY_DN15153_c0_g1_i1.p2  ORF type:complete len:156 (+),score=23.70 TRINITY_DN15153_c0_g1_i1:285-752(+)